MNKILSVASVALLMSTSMALADGRHNRKQNNYYQNNYYYRNNNNGWVAPAIGLGILGGVIAGGMLYNNAPYYAAPVPVPQCWNQSFYDQYGRMYVQQVCN